MTCDNDSFYDLEPVVDLYHFVELFLVTLANEDSLLPLCKDTRTIRKVKLCTDYKAKLEKAMYSDEAIDFLQLIGYFEYYEYQSKWEERFSECLKKYCEDNGKKVSYNFEYDYVEIEYTVDEISSILEKYDELTKKAMKKLLFCSEIDDWFSFYERKNELRLKEDKRYAERKYIQTGPHTFGKVWDNK